MLLPEPAEVPASPAWPVEHTPSSGHADRDRLGESKRTGGGEAGRGGDPAGDRGGGAFGCVGGDAGQLEQGVDVECPEESGQGVLIRIS